MKAIILAAGLGTRLKPITDTMPKALVKVWGEPILKTWMYHLYACRFREVTVNVHHFADQIIDFLDNLTIPIQIPGMTVHISDERDMLLDTGGGIRKAAKMFKDNDEPVLVVNVDIMTNALLPKLYYQHKEEGNDATLLVSDRKTSRYLIFDKANHLLCGWTNKKTGQMKPEGFTYNPDTHYEAAFSGIHVISPTVLKYMDDNCPPKFSIIDFYLDVCHKFRIRAVEQEDTFVEDIGKIETLKRMSQT